jgi:hypothetical protein
MDVVSVNAHFPGGNLRQRARALIDLLTRIPDISTKFICIQEGCSTLHRVLSGGPLRRTHDVYPPRSDRGGGPFLITLVPHSIALSGAVTRVAFPAHMSPMGREAHVCAVGRTILVHTHLESCSDSAHYRAAQVGHLLDIVGGHGGKLLVVGDLNGYGDWRRQYLQRGMRVESSRRRLPVTPHFLFSHRAA